MAMAGASSAMEPSSGRDGGATMPMTPIGSTMATATARERRIVHGAVVFVGPAGEGEEALDGEHRLPFRPRLGLAGLLADAGGEFVAAVVEVLGEEEEDLRARDGRAALAQPSAARAASTALRMSLRLPSPTSPTSAPPGPWTGRE